MNLLARLSEASEYMSTGLSLVHSSLPYSDTVTGQPADSEGTRFNYVYGLGKADT